jgi:hypothetical protein
MVDKMIITKDSDGVISVTFNDLTSEDEALSYELSIYIMDDEREVLQRSWLIDITSPCNDGIR